eukprot:3573907-Amphidinium_carterae.1
MGERTLSTSIFTVHEGFHAKIKLRTSDQIYVLRQKPICVANKIENGSEILGFTAIKDKLQENVGETIEA